MEPKDPPHQGDPNPAVTDAWGLPIPPPASWQDPHDPQDDLGYCVGDDPQDRWD